MFGKCSRCKHWAGPRPDDGHEVALIDGEQKVVKMREPGTAPFGFCDADIHDDDAPPGGCAVGVYDLETHADFGCALFEPREEPEPWRWSTEGSDGSVVDRALGGAVFITAGVLPRGDRGRDSRSWTWFVSVWLRDGHGSARLSVGGMARGESEGRAHAERAAEWATAYHAGHAATLVGEGEEPPP